MTTREYNECVDQHADGVFRFVLKNIRDEELARDVVQDAFTKMWEKAEGIQPDKAKSYLFTAAYHTMIDAIRKEKRMVSENDSYYPEPSSTKGYSDLQEVLDEALLTLPEIQRSAVLLRDYEGYSYKEIGDMLNLNESQVKVYIYRARLTLKKYIGSLETVL